MDPLLRRRTDEDVLRILKAFEILRIMDREIPGQLVSAFLYVASHNPCHKLAMEEDLGFTIASSSRCADWLSDVHRLNKPGLGLIKKEKDPTNLRRVMLRLTPKGEQVARQLKEIIYD